MGVPTDVQNTTIGKTDEGQGKNVVESKHLVEQGYEMLHQLIINIPDEDWLETIDTPFFGTIPRLRLFAHILFHNSHHAGKFRLLYQEVQLMHPK